MSFFILSGQITTLFLSLQFLTTLSFQTEIESFLYGGSKEDVFFEVTNQNKTLAIRPHQKLRFSNLLVVTKKRSFYFNLAYDEKNSHQFIDIKVGQKNHAFKEKIDNKDYQIMEGESSLLFVNKKDAPVKVNAQEVERKTYISKGVPILIDGERVLN